MIPKTFNCVIFLICILKVSGKPQGEEQRGPCVGMDCLHGVLMHGDDSQGDDHKTEDQYLRFKEQLDTEQPKAGPVDAEQLFHGALMHGDNELGQHHEEKADYLPEVKGEAGPKDLSEYMHEAMHGEEGVRKHSWDSDEAKSGEQRGPIEGDKLMHGVLMHGDAEHSEEHEDKEKDEEVNSNAGPVDAGEYLHGVLMHDDDTPGKKHDHHDNGADSGEEEGKMKGPSGDQLHGILMHGDSEIGHDHTEEDSQRDEEVFRDIRKILEMELGEDLLRIIDIEKILEQDFQEYEDWVKDSDSDSLTTGSTQLSVSDSILNDIQLMKQKYLEKANEQIFNSKETDEFPFTAEDAMSVLESGSMDGDGEDMTHDLELLGSTEPLNARHRVKLELLKAKSKK